VRLPLRADLLVQYGHDALSNEAYGSSAVYAQIAARGRGVVATGPLTIDLGAPVVTVAGREVLVTPREYGILARLADPLGRCCGHHELVVSVWDSITAELWARPRRTARWAPLRMAILAVRARLGDARYLLETVPRRGYRLRAEPVWTREEG
jgi:two-component system KDP operon response regulator KdpE